MMSRLRFLLSFVSPSVMIDWNVDWRESPMSDPSLPMKVTGSL